MTMSVTIVNTSNWDGEDIEVGAGRRLKPGEQVSSSLEHVDGAENTFIITSRPAADVKPFQDGDGHQKLPHVAVTFKTYS